MGFERRGLIAILCGISLLAACAGYTPVISKDEKPTPKDAYLYGRFAMFASKPLLALGGYQTMGFSIKCDGEQPLYVLRFDVDAPLQVIKIRPSTCSLTELVYTDADGFVKSRKPAPDQLMRNAVFAAGKGYYLGDFSAEATRSLSGRNIHSEWRLRDVKHEYDKTTNDMKAAFPNLSQLPTEDRMIGR
jgi:hypothetical protein